MNNATDLTSYMFFQRLTQLPFIEAIYLYGSRARGDHQARSDIDLAVLCPQAQDAEWHQVSHIIADADTLLKIDCVRLDRLQDGRLRRNILEDGIKLYG